MIGVNFSILSLSQSRGAARHPALINIDTFVAQAKISSRLFSTLICEKISSAETGLRAVSSYEEKRRYMIIAFNILSFIGFNTVYSV